MQFMKGKISRCHFDFGSMDNLILLLGVPVISTEPKKGQQPKIGTTAQTAEPFAGINKPIAPVL